MGGTILFGMGILLRRLLGLGRTNPRHELGLDPEQRSLCEAVTEEVGSRSAILAVLLNESIEELAAGNAANAADLLDLAEGEWISLAHLLSSILRNVADYLPVAHIAIPVRSKVSEHFRSDVMIDYLRLHEWVDQFALPAKVRFRLQLKVLRHAVNILTADFRRAEARRHLGTPLSRALWNRLDRDYHDFDLIAKRTILAFGKFSSWLPQSAAAGFFLALRPTLDRGVRVKSRTAVLE